MVVVAQEVIVHLDMALLLYKAVQLMFAEVQRIQLQLELVELVEKAALKQVPKEVIRYFQL
tara:strand:- start:359 stop:541 length:183 start_codon:yes stop_codon:yes gene_type:complete